MIVERVFVESFRKSESPSFAHHHVLARVAPRYVNEFVMGVEFRQNTNIDVKEIDHV